MKKIIVSIIVVGLFVPQAVESQGTTYLSNLGQASNGSLAVGSNLWLAVDIITGNNANGYELNSVELAMDDASGNPSGFTVMIYTANIGGGILPGNSLGTLDGSANPSTNGIYTYTDDSDLTLSPHTDYFVVLTAGTAVTNGAYEWNLTSTYSYNSTGGWAVGNDEGNIAVFYSSLNGLSWTGNQGNLQFSLTATSIPEPSPSWILLLGSGIFIYARRAFHR